MPATAADIGSEPQLDVRVRAKERREMQDVLSRWLPRTEGRRQLTNQEEILCGSFD